MNKQVTWSHLTMTALWVLINELPDERFEAGPDDLLADGSHTCCDLESKNAVRLTYRRGDTDDVLVVKIMVVFAGALIGAEFELDGDDLKKRDIDYFSGMFIKPACHAIADRIDDCTAHRTAH